MSGIALGTGFVGVILTIVGLQKMLDQPIPFVLSVAIGMVWMLLTLAAFKE